MKLPVSGWLGIIAVQLVTFCHRTRITARVNHVAFRSGHRHVEQQNYIDSFFMCNFVTMAIPIVHNLTFNDIVK